jgi:hypothetical protein
MLGLAVSLVPLIAALLLSGAPWANTIDHGELVLITISVLTSAVAYSAMTPVATGFPPWVKALVIGVGLIIVLFAALAYWTFSEVSPSGGAVTCLTKSLHLTANAASNCLREPSAHLPVGTITDLSYWLFGLSFVVAVVSLVSRGEHPSSSTSSLS